MNAKYDKIYILVVFFAAGLVTCTLFAQTNDYSLTIKAGSLRQSFAGFGASQATRWNLIPEAPRNQMADMIYRDLKMNVLRLWVNDAYTNTLNDMLSTFNASYIASGAIADITNRGVTTLLLAPASSNSPEASPPSSIPDYAAKMATFILQLKTTYAIHIDATGIANEPEGRWSSSQIVDCINGFRTELDARGLDDVKIIAPESSNYYSALQSISAIKNNGTAWNNLFGIASHSYGMLQNNSLELIKGDKTWWSTEASGDDENEQAEDECYACTILARFLCEMNHGMDEWIFFIGLGQVSDISTYQIGTAFMMLYDLKTASIVPLLKYYYFKQALSTFDVNCIFRQCVSVTEGDMFLTTRGSTNQHSAINAAAAYNPDGSWGVCVVNDTGVTNTLATFPKVFYPASTYTVTVTVEELTNTPSMSFTVYRSRAGTHVEDSGIVTFTNGVGTFSVQPRELVSLRSEGTEPAIAPPPDGFSVSGNTPLISLV